MVEQTKTSIYRNKENDEFLDQLMIRVKDWLKLADEPNCSFNEMPPVVREAVDIPVPAKGQGLEGVLKSIDEYLAHSVRTHHPGFMNPFWGGFDRAAFAGELMSLLTQRKSFGSLFTDMF